LIKNRIFSAKTGFFRSFSEAKSHHVGYFGANNFPQALIPKRLEIICEVFWEIYTPLGYRGGRGVPPQFSVVSG
jgi:hypothetical protein